MSILFSRLFRELVRTTSRTRNVTSNLEKQQHRLYSYSTGDPSKMTRSGRRTTAPKLKKYNSLPLNLPSPEEKFPSGSPKQTAQFLTGKDPEGRSVVIHPLIGGGKSILRKSYKGDLVPLVPPDEVLTNNKLMDKKPTVRLRIRRRIREALRYVLPLVGRERHDYLFFGRLDTHEAEWEELKDAVHAAIALPRLYNFNLKDKRGGPNYLEYIERVGYKARNDNDSRNNFNSHNRNNHSNRRDFYGGVQGEKYAQKSGKLANDKINNNYGNSSSRNNYDNPRNKLNNEDSNYRDWDLQPLKTLRDNFNDLDKD
ncbi:7411_t:CDS:2 [Ambispora leptoticha]|uniref:7411_t:CDS:1 n=1 Tax=Ambispora leptoticha TaxID=144679 RepID=A0A9N9BLF4_9GLOM|nr:7411_t:CDS:2 [Ambispora leptoticha]